MAQIRGQPFGPENDRLKEMNRGHGLATLGELRQRCAARHPRFELLRNRLAWAQPILERWAGKSRV
jgi:hypothetical protein